MMMMMMKLGNEGLGERKGGGAWGVLGRGVNFCLECEQNLLKLSSILCLLMIRNHAVVRSNTDEC